MIAVVICTSKQHRRSLSVVEWCKSTLGNIDPSCVCIGGGYLAQCRCLCCGYRMWNVHTSVTLKLFARFLDLGISTQVVCVRGRGCVRDTTSFLVLRRSFVGCTYSYITSIQYDIGVVCSCPVPSCAVRPTERWRSFWSERERRKQREKPHNRRSRERKWPAASRPKRRM